MQNGVRFVASSSCHLFHSLPCVACLLLCLDKPNLHTLLTLSIITPTTNPTPNNRTALGMYDYIQEAIDRGECLLEWDGGPDHKPPPAPLLKDKFGSERRKAKVSWCDPEGGKGEGCVCWAEPCPPYTPTSQAHRSANTY